MRNNFLVFFLIFTLFSCYKKKELPNAQELLRRELHTIDWTRVDTYPSFDSCDTLTDKKKLEECFFVEFSQQLEHHLMQDSLIQYLKKMEDISVKVSVKSDEKIIIKAADFNKQQISQQMLDSILEICATKISPIHAATKRGVPVTTEFDLKVKLHEPLD